MITGKYYVYIIESDGGRRYVGLSADPEIRLSQHNNKLSRWTKSYGGWKIIYKKEFKNYTEARKWELYLKKQKGGNGLKNIIAGWSNGSSRGS